MENPESRPNKKLPEMAQDSPNPDAEIAEYSENDYPTDKNSYKLCEVIGKSSGATVYKAICIPKKSSVVAIKIIHFDIPFRWADREVEPTNLPPHANILHRYCSFVVDRPAGRWVVMPYISGGSLQSIMASHFTSGIPHKFFPSILKQALSALTHLHRQELIHGNIKPGNILVDGDGTVKLADNGVSATFYTLFPASMQYWMAPEVERHAFPTKGYGKEADIWSLGVTLLELSDGRPPLSQIPTPAQILLRSVIEERFRFLDPNLLDKNLKRFLFDDLRTVLGRCLVEKSSERETAMEILKDPYLEGVKEHELLKKLLEDGVPALERRLEGDHLYRDRYRSEERWVIGWEFKEESLEFVPVFGQQIGHVSLVRGDRDD